MKILLGVTGIGLGHATRSHAIVNELKANSRLKVVTWGNAYDYYTNEGMKVEKVPSVDYKGDFAFSMLYNVLESFKEPKTFGKGYKKFREIADEFRPDIIFSDSEPNSFFYSYKSVLPSYTLMNVITVIDNFSKIPKKYVTRDLKLQRLTVSRLVSFMLRRGSRFYVPAFETKLKFIDKVKYTDLIVRHKPFELPALKKIREKNDLPDEYYYVHVGGADIEKPLFEIFRRTLPKFEDKFFVVSSNYATKKETVEGNMKIIPFVNNADEIIKASKGVICPAGHTSISENIVFRKPMLVIPIRNHVEQMVNASIVKSEGFGGACFTDRKISVSVLKLHLDEFFSKEDEFSENLKSSNFRGNGAEQIAKDMLK